MGMSDFTVVECQHPVNMACVRGDGVVICMGLVPHHKRPGGAKKLEADRDELRVAFEEFYMERERSAKSG